MNDRDYARINGEIMLAYADGKAIQYRERPGVPLVTASEAEWSDHQSPEWNWCDFEYRVKPEPKEVIAWEKDGRLYFPQYHFPETEWIDDGYRKILFREVIE